MKKEKNKCPICSEIRKDKFPWMKDYKHVHLTKEEIEKAEHGSGIFEYFASDPSVH